MVCTENNTFEITRNDALVSSQMGVLQLRSLRLSLWVNSESLGGHGPGQWPQRGFFLPPSADGYCASLSISWAKTFRALTMACQGRTAVQQDHCGVLPWRPIWDT